MGGAVRERALVPARDTSFEGDGMGIVLWIGLVRCFCVLCRSSNEFRRSRVGL